ncbi:Rid family hydrolase [Actinopolymorpha rutila]|uniref:Enamine deaminase RidA (YjgF/YER057c/UK114 family) n=1 Tax=Actinopolymorpha rutila TaxID=446787 RepID=A0A852ZH04_9ACTN|nr:enamine deaminase RidA (YjgF/YER057c/UK114 family) [Actinopolymorpha rutila]
MARRRVASGNELEREYGYSRAVSIGNRVLVAGTAPVWEDGEVDPDPGVQAFRCIEIILTALAQVGAGPEHVVRTRMYVTDAAHADAVGRVHGKVFGEIRPVTSMLVVAGLLDPRWKVEIEAEAMLLNERTKWGRVLGGH